MPKKGSFTFVAGEPALILSRKRGMARFPNKGLALRHDLGERSTVILRRIGYQILPESAFEILCGNPIRIVCRSSE
jgi:hypothetical protein